jgi:excisionase family DNA binding protein
MPLRMLTVAETAELLGVSVERVRQFCYQGRLGHKVGRDWVITEEELAALERKPVGRPKKDNAKSPPP